MSLIRRMPRHELPVHPSTKKVHLSRYFLESYIRLLRTKYGVGQQYRAVLQGLLSVPHDASAVTKSPCHLCCKSLHTLKNKERVSVSRVPWGTGNTSCRTDALPWRIPSVVPRGLVLCCKLEVGENGRNREEGGRMSQDAQPIKLPRRFQSLWHGLITKENMPQWWRRLAAFFWVAGIEEVAIVYHTRAAYRSGYFLPDSERYVER
jgi:hypothetical protein